MFCLKIGQFKCGCTVFVHPFFFCPFKENITFYILPNEQENLWNFGFIMEVNNYMRSVTPMKTAKTGYIIISILLCILGVTLIIFPQFSSKALGTLCGIIFIVFGIVKLVGYFSKDLFRLAFQFDFEFGILLFVLGIILLVHPGSLVNFICIAFGISVLGDGLFKIRIALEAKKFGIEKWWISFAVAIISAVLGLILIFRPGEGSEVLMIFLGITLLAEGVLSLITVITMVKIINHQQPDVIDVQVYDESED